MSTDDNTNTDPWVRMRIGMSNAPAASSPRSANADPRDFLLGFITSSLSQESPWANSEMRNALSTSGEFSQEGELSVQQTSFTPHSPRVRSMFYDLKSQIRDLDAIYGLPSDLNVECAFIPTDVQETYGSQLTECVGFFTTSMREAFECYASEQNKLNVIKTELKKYESLLNILETPLSENDTLERCTESIVSSIQEIVTTFTENKSAIEINRDHYWAQYCGLRDMCSSVDSIQSDPICKMCYGTEIDTALNCGHTMCAACALRISVCPVCRTGVHQKLKIYVS